MKIDKAGKSDSWGCLEFSVNFLPDANSSQLWQDFGESTIHLELNAGYGIIAEVRSVVGSTIAVYQFQDCP